MDSISNAPASRVWPLHPFLLAAVPVFAIFQNNVLEVPPADLLRPLLVWIGLALALYLLGRRITRSTAAAALLSTCVIMLCYSYPMLFSVISKWIPGAAHHRFVLPLWAAGTGAACALAVLVPRWKGWSLEQPTRYLNTLSAILCVLVAAQAAIQHHRTSDRITSWGKGAAADDPDPLGSTLTAAVQAAKAAGTPRPDIYFIILDGYARADILESRFGFDNQEFLKWLRETGFFVADRSVASYPHTHLSLSSTLNFDYLQTLLPAGFGADAPTDYKPRFQYFSALVGNRLLRGSRVQRFLENLGYKVLKETYGFAITRQVASNWRASLRGPITDFERTVFQRAALGPLVEFAETRAAAPRAAPVNYNLRLLREIPVLADVAGPKFVFYHINAPHPPFSFDADGRTIPPHPVFDASPWLADCLMLPGYREYFHSAYPKNVAGLNGHVRETLTALLQKTERKAVLIVQSDHGSHMAFHPLEAAQTDVPERFATLNAVFLPDGFSRSELRGDLSLANTFRVVLNSVFGMDLPLLEPRAWYSTGDLAFEEITSRLAEAPRRPTAP